MPAEPLNTLAGVLERLQLTSIVDCQVFEHGEVDKDALSQYQDIVLTSFYWSDQGRAVMERNNGLHWTWTFLEHGIEYLGVKLNEMTVANASEILFRLFPRKLSVVPESAADIVFELEQFFTFAAAQLPDSNAGDIVKAVRGSEKRLRKELADPSNYDPAKAFVMAGHSQGFNMSTPEGIQEFTALYNDSLVNRRIDTGHTQALPQPSAAPPTQREPATATEKRERRKERKKVLALKKRKKR